MLQKLFLLSMCLSAMAFGDVALSETSQDDSVVITVEPASAENETTVATEESAAPPIKKTTSKKNKSKNTTKKENTSSKSSRKTLEYKICAKHYSFSTEYEMTHKNKPIGTVVTPRLSIRTNYDLFDKKGNMQANGKFAMLNPSAWSRWWGEGGCDIYVVDADGNDVGYIDGELMTTEKAKYTFYGSQGQVQGIAYLDTNKTGFTIVHPDYDTCPIAHLKRNFVMDTIDDWSVSVYDTEMIDVRLVKIFSAFAVDVQDKFKKDN